MANCAWNKEYHKISLIWEPRIVRVLNDEALKQFLSERAGHPSSRLAAYARHQYRKIYGEELQITQRSLACEIYWHYVIREKSFRFEERFGKKRFTNWLIFHMDVIDCGEKSVDNNRFVWDLLSIVFFR